MFNFPRDFSGFPKHPSAQNLPSESQKGLVEKKDDNSESKVRAPMPFKGCLSKGLVHLETQGWL